MKNIVIICLTALIANIGFAQEEKLDSVKVKIGDMKIIVIDDENNIIKDTSFKDIFDDKDKFHSEENKGNKVWAGLDLGVNGYVNSNRQTLVPPAYNYLDLDYTRSYTFSFNFMEHDIKIIDEYVKITTGLGVEWKKFAFSENTRLNSGGPILTGAVDTVQSFVKTKLSLAYINLPLLLTFNTDKHRKKGGQLAAGVIFGYKAGERTKIVYEDANGKKNKDIARGDYHTNPFNYELTARLSYNKFRIFATYNLNSLFVDGEGPELYPFSIGLTLLRL
jgi:hypothetical protein